MCLVAIALPLAGARGAPGDFAPASYVGSLDPHMIWELLIGGIVVAVVPWRDRLWVLSALRRFKRSQLRRNAFISSALNHLNQGVVMTDPKGRIVFCNERYLEIYGLARADMPAAWTGRNCWSCGAAAACSMSVSRISTPAPAMPEGLVTELPNGKAVLVKYF